MVACTPVVRFYNDILEELFFCVTEVRNCTQITQGGNQYLREPTPNADLEW
jgi:hypothetical protein